MVKNFTEFIDSIEETSKGKGKRAKSAKHYLEQLRSIDKFYLLLMSTVEYISNACNLREFNHSFSEKIEYFKIKNTRSKGIRLIYDVKFDLRFGSPIFAYIFEKAYKHLLMEGEIIKAHQRLNERMDMCRDVIKNIKLDVSKITDSFVIENGEVVSFYDIDDDDVQVSFVKCALSIKIDLNKLNV